MAGFKSDPLGYVQQITNDLRDRYKCCFPIIKEMLQNADDSQANSLVIGWHEGIKNAHHPLLNFPALFFVNDAPLSLKDVKGIMSLGLGSKADNSNAVGKFGLGMKSLFHFGEVFFFLAHDWRQEAEKAEVLNPWDDMRPEWNSFHDHDKQLIENVVFSLEEVIKKDFFIVWVPLRSSSSMISGNKEYPSIIQSENFGDQLPHFLLENGIVSNISKIMPMLKHLKHVSALQIQSKKITPLFKVNVDENSQRRQYPNLSKNQEHVLQGKVSILNQSPVLFSGLEKYYDNENLDSVRRNAHWPHSFKRDDVGAEKKVPDKSDSHSAVMILRYQARSRPTLAVRWAVFLPLGDQDTSQTEQTYHNEIEGEFSYEILLHGQFFIDAGRVGIHGARKIGTDSSVHIDNEEDLFQEWNRLLANQGTLPLITKAINYAIQSFALDNSAIASLMRGFRSYVSSRQGYADKVTSQHQLVRSLTGGKPSWKLISNNHATRPLILPKGQDFDRVWELFPVLMNPSYELVDQAADNITQKIDYLWKAEELKELIQKIDIKYFESQKHLDYLGEFLRSVGIPFECQSAVIDLIRRALVHHSLTKLSANTKLIQQLIALIGANERFAIKIDKNEQTAWNVIKQVKLDKLLIPDFLHPELEQSETKLSLDDVGVLLKSLDKSLLDVDLIDQLTQQLLASLSKQDREELLKQNEFLKVFTAYHVGSRKAHRVSRNELNALYKNRRLFSFAKPNDFGLAEYLRDALKDKDILFINGNINKTLFGGETKPCDSASIINLLKTNPILDNVNARVALVNKLDLDNIANTDNDSLLAVRYLLHASSSDNSSLCYLWLTANAPRVWVKLHTEVLGEDDQWTVLPYEVSGQIKLTVNEKARLKIREQSIADIRDEVINYIDAIDFSNVVSSQEEAEEILCEIDDAHLWKHLPLHITEEGRFISIDNHCYFKSELKLPAELSNEVSWMRRAQRREVQKMQEQYIKTFSEKSAINLALEFSYAHQFEKEILNWLNALNDESFTELKTNLSHTKWLVDPIKRPIAPIQILHLDDKDWPQTHRLWSREGLLTLSEMAQHKGLPRELKHLCLNAENEDRLISSLVNQAKVSKDYGLGRLSLNDELLRQATSCQSVLDGLPAWLLVIEIIRNFPETPINAFDDLIKDAPHQNLLDAYNKLINKFANKHAGLRLGLLTAILAQTSDIHKLAEMRFLTQSEAFKPLKTLVYEVEGADPDYLIHNNDYQKLTVCFGCFNSRQATEVVGNLDANSIEFEKTVAELEHYCKDIETQIDDPLMIAATIVFMTGTPGIEKIFNLYRGSRTAEGLLDIVGCGWKKDFMKDVSHNIRGVFYGKSLIEAVKSMTFSLAVIHSEQIKTQSLLGQEVTIPLSKDMRTIFVDDNLSYANQKHLRVFIRPIPQHLQPDDVSRILKNSAEYLLREVYEQPIQLDQLWENFNKVEQVDIEVAKLTMADNLEAKLRELKIKDQDESIANWLQRYESSLNRAAENGQSMDQSDRMELIRGMWQEIESRDELQSITLQSVREKIKQAQYHTNSIPFELFQNADDACVELIELGGDLTNDQKVFRVIEADDSLAFCNWGRQVNQYAITADKNFGEQRGFKRDLQKMIALHQSDKREEVTGKFGLGFKSCLLASDSPHIVSGKLAAQIKGGILPVISEKVDELTLLASRNLVSGKKPTLIHLPLALDTTISCVMKSFRENAAILPVFAKSITVIELGGKDSFSWYPEKHLTLADRFKVERGSIQLIKGEKNTTVDVMKLSLTTDFGDIQILFQLGKNGLTYLDESIKRLWNLAPLSNDMKLGFAVNANFEVDIGRNQLAIDSSHNQEIFSLIGRELASFFSVVHDRGIDSVGSVFRDTLSQDEFWNGVWQTLTKQLGADDALVSHMFHAERGLLSFFKHYAVVPTRLPSSSASRSLISMNAIKFMASSLLSKKDIIQHLAELPTLKSLLADGLIVANEVGRTIQKMLGSEQLIVEKSVAELFAEMLSESGQDTYLSPKNANLLESFYNDELMKLIKEDFNESFEIESVFKHTFVKVRNEAHQPLSDVLLSNTESKDEQLVIGFAPEEYLLSPEYDQIAITLLKRIRTGTPFNAEDLFTWISRHDVETNFDKQRSIVCYILNGNYANQLIERIKRDRAPIWLVNLKRQTFIDWGFAPSQWKDWEYALKSNQEKEREYFQEHGSQVEDDLEESINPPEDALLRIYDWWVNRGKQQHLFKYEQGLIPPSLDFAHIKDDTDADAHKKAWLKLLFLGACQTIGRVKDEQNRSAIEHFDRQGWWDVFIRTDNPQQWFDVLNEYLDQCAGDEVYRQWLQLLPLYRFSKYFDDYLDVFTSADGGIELLSDITTPARSRLLAGSCISYPTLKATMGIGINFVLRELTRNGFYQQTELAPFCYVTSKQVVNLLKEINIDLDDEPKENRSYLLHQCLLMELSEEQAIFDGDFDIPFRVLAADESLLRSVLYSQ